MLSLLNMQEMFYKRVLSYTKLEKNITSLSLRTTACSSSLIINTSSMLLNMALKEDISTTAVLLTVKL